MVPVEKIDIPDELKALNPETQGKPIVIGKQGYMIYPLTEGQVERVSKLLSDIVNDVFTHDLICPNCNYVHKDMLGKKETCNRCKGKHRLNDLQKTPLEALSQDDRALKFLEELINVPVAETRDLITIPQFKHLVGVLYEQNFKEEGIIPEKSRKNFQAVLGWIGPGLSSKTIQDNPEQVLATSTKPLHMSTDLEESTSKEGGRGEKMAESSS